ncbi:MAG: integrase catalytic domain-containing protein [Bacteroidaceae bacterium]|nr:integrase catalytic domain-containing protein [Bacteroidaceae bacterium]
MELLEKYSSYLERKPRDIEAKCLDAFLFCCYTGMRYSDFIRLSSANFDFRSKESWLSYRSVKTGMDVKIPLGLMFEGKGLKLIERYGNGLLEFFNLPSNAVTDRVLNKVYHKAGLEEHISFHSSRHTNATILLYKGVSVTTVQKLLGHKNIRTTMRYCAIMDQTIVRELKEYSN